MLDKGRAPGALQDKAMAKIKGTKVKGKREEAKKEMEDLGPILRA
jgi:hypothetical protein